LDGANFDVFVGRLLGGQGQHPLDIDAGQVHRIGVDLAGLTPPMVIRRALP